MEYRIQDAIDITNDIDAKILEDNVDILFSLLSVTMMEIIKKVCHGLFYVVIVLRVI